jgi:hypothetical protein
LSELLPEKKDHRCKDQKEEYAVKGQPLSLCCYPEHPTNCQIDHEKEPVVGVGKVLTTPTGTALLPENPTRRKKKNATVKRKSAVPERTKSQLRKRSSGFNVGGGELL